MLAAWMVVGCAAIPAPTTAPRDSDGARVKKSAPREVAKLPVVAPPPAWVCEVESSSKVFTGVGSTRDEASVQARGSCSSHFQARSCAKAECKVAADPFASW